MEQRSPVVGTGLVGGRAGLAALGEVPRGSVCVGLAEPQRTRRRRTHFVDRAARKRPHQLLRLHVSLRS